MVSYDNHVTITGSEQRLLDLLNVITNVSEIMSLQQISDELINTIYAD